MIAFFKRYISNNIGLKLIAVLFAFILWLVVVNIDDPSQSQNFTVKVSVLNDEVLTSQGKYYNIVDGANTVTFRVTAKRSVIERLSNSDFTATADMNYLENDSRIPIEIVANRYQSSLTIAAKARYLEMEIGEEMNAKFIISGLSGGTPAAGYMVDSISVTPNVINVDGPSEIVSLIDRVAATCDVEGMNTDITENVVPVFYDAEGNVIDTTRLSTNISTVEVSAHMTSVKTVPIEVEASGMTAEGKLIDEIATDPAEISIKGDSSVLNVTGKVVIPSEAIGAAGATESFTTTVDITTYLPDGVSLASSSQSQITVTVTVADMIGQTFSIPTANIEVRDLSSDYTLEFESLRAEVTIFGTARTLSLINAGSITGYVDASGITTTGKHELLLHPDLGDEYASSETNVAVTVSAQGSNDTTTDTTGNDTEEVND